MKAFYLVHIVLSKDITIESLKTQMDKALDWYRIGDETWIVYTSKDAAAWHTRLTPLVKPDGSVFISRLDLEDRNGWMKKDFWRWLKKDRDTNHG